MLNISNIKALTFDTGGTILDWHSGFFKGFEELIIKYKLNFSATEFANLMRKKVFREDNNSKSKLFNKF